MTRPGRAACLALLAVSLGALAAPAAPCAAEVVFTPRVSVSEEYNDNVFGSADARRTDYITRVQPGVGLAYQGPQATGDLSYSFDYHTYARGSRKDETYHYLSLHGLINVGEFLYLEVSDSLNRVSLDVTRATAVTESSFLNQVTQNMAIATPYLLWHPVDKGVLRTGYRFTDTRYWGSSGIEKRAHQLFTDFSHQTTARLSFNAGYSFTRVSTSPDDYQQHDISVGTRFEYADKSAIYGGIGNNWQDFAGRGRDLSSFIWNAGLTHSFGHFLASLETRVSFIEDPQSASTKETSYLATLTRPLEHGGLSLNGSYSEDRDARTGLLRKRAALGGSGNYELTPRLMMNLSVTGDRVSRVDFDTLPYHLNAGAGLTLNLARDLTAALNYTYVEYRRGLRDATGSHATNKVLLEIRKVLAK